MDAQSFTTPIQCTPQKLYPGSENRAYCELDVRSHAPGSWSIKRFLSVRGSRRYRVLEREPNRLRKRASP
ncbi:hypothetical protein N7510_003983 [Penicillium lagena]|uniref:uncharacterized protein n=1 Tax=Penicillium lagena TaxID=94218 RepID=UPI0025421BE3|nr:uncharacterized protein N7510_003983 [Penicillium lagena]KAJ5619999.1 hypothetical protein N7510_003983 [Penicillium lagena]